MKLLLSSSLLFIFLTTSYSQNTDSLCQKNTAKIDSITNGVIQSLNLSNNYWIYYQAPKWANGYKLYILDINNRTEYRIDSFSKKRMKKNKIRNSQMKDILLLDSIKEKKCSIVLMDDGGEGYLKRINSGKLTYISYYLGTTSKEMEDLLVMLKFW